MASTLRDIPNQLRKAVFALLILQMFGVAFGLAHLMLNTQGSVEGTTAFYRGDEVEDAFEIPERYPKPISELLITTHNHLLGFSFLFGFVVLIFHFSSILKGRWKTFLMVEPFVSVLGTFLSIWGLRFVSPLFIVPTVLFGALTYASYFTITGLILWELMGQGPEKISSR